MFCSDHLYYQTAQKISMWILGYWAQKHDSKHDKITIYYYKSYTFQKQDCGKRKLSNLPRWALKDQNYTANIKIIMFCNVTSLVLVYVRQHYRITHLPKCTESRPTSLQA